MLDRIQIKGYKSIRDLNLALRPVNILIGSNGVGKSNFISFFKLVNNIYERRLQSYTMRNRAESLLYYGVKRTAEIYGCLSSSDSVYMFELSPRDDGSMFLAEERTKKVLSVIPGYMCINGYKELWKVAMCIISMTHPKDLPCVPLQRSMTTGY